MRRRLTAPSPDGLTMPIFAISTQEFTRLTRNLPRAEQIADLFRYAGGGGRWGEWVGPAPRVTREKFLTQGYRTRVTWLLRFPDDQWNRDHQEYLLRLALDAITARIQQLSLDWETPHAQPYAVALNGPVSWWESGQAARTRTSVVEPAVWDQYTMPVENPIGPDTRESSRLAELGQATLAEPAWSATRWALVTGGSAVVLYGAFWAITRWGAGGSVQDVTHALRGRHALPDDDDILEPEVLPPRGRLPAQSRPTPRHAIVRAAPAH